MSTLEQAASLVLISIFVFLFSIGVWQLKRKINWYLGYESEVQTKISVMYEDRIKELEERVKVLEKVTGLRNY